MASTRPRRCDEDQKFDRDTHRVAIANSRLIAVHFGRLSDSSEFLGFPNRFSMIHGWSALGGLTMAEWEDELEGWLKPFLQRL
ncbi:hypothetical protein, partial [Bradyrhizobium sp. 180]|uniref:hypothetical protein n=1 Tax=Bradyrhizobium sp. 180 TaxID=2782650 RepID=UPI001FFB4B46